MNNEARLGTERIPPLMAKLAIPSIAAQLVNILYNMVDRMYIGRMADVGHLALTGLGLTFPIIVIVLGFSAFVGAGGAPLAAIALGAGDREKAERILGNSTTLLAILSAVIPVIVLAIQEPMLYAFGASGNTIGYAMDYLTIYILGTVFVQFSFGLNMFITAQGQAKTAMLSVVIGAVANIILDPILIFSLDMGVRGAALATVISQAISAVWVVAFLLSKKSSIHIKKGMLKLERQIVGSIAALGVSPFVMRATECMVQIVVNSGFQRYGGDLYVGSFTISISLMQTIIAFVDGYALGVQPMIGYNYGAGKLDRVRKVSKYMILVSVAFTTAFYILVLLAPGFFARIFTKEAEMIALMTRVLPVYFGGVWLFGAQLGIQAILVSLRQAKASLFLALLRKVFLLIPLAVILPRHFGVMGIYYAEPIASFLSACTAIVIFTGIYRKILKE